mmetsp:Transcript_127115/g.395621  ORF Transcript_127115/g.395621 Transcript_127115/m.395621 type:complete len:195 (+) Transcript_127115:71-655(+)
MTRVALAAMLAALARICVGVRDEALDLDGSRGETVVSRGRLQEHARQHGSLLHGDAGERSEAAAAEPSECSKQGGFSMWDKFKVISAKHMEMSTSEASEIRDMLDPDVVIAVNAATKTEMTGAWNLVDRMQQMPPAQPPVEEVQKMVDDRTADFLAFYGPKQDVCTEFFAHCDQGKWTVWKLEVNYAPHRCHTR